MSYRSFTWNLTEPEARRLQFLLEHYVLEEPRFRYKVDRFLAEELVSKCKIFRGLSTDGATASHSSADA